MSMQVYSIGWVREGSRNKKRTRGNGSPKSLLLSAPLSW